MMMENSDGINESQEKKAMVAGAPNDGTCPECGRQLLLGSRDPCEGDYYWCPNCGAGPIRFPLYHQMPIVSPSIIDAGRCVGCPALKVCSAIVPGGPWNPAPGNGVKACPGVRV
jgi:hypothetical protein